MVDVSGLIETNLSCNVVRMSQTKRLVILSAGVLKEYDGKKKLQLLVEIDGKQLPWTPNKTTLQAISAKYSANSDTWVGKPVALRLSIIQGKESILGEPC